MKKWYYSVRLSNGEKLTGDGYSEGIDYTVRRAVSHILYRTNLDMKARLVINIYDYPPPFGQATHMFEFNVLK